jgi:hypothetical protein
MGQRASWYAWSWGDALFVVLDPYWSTRTKPGQDAWALTLGERQYRWLEATLSGSPARFKFVFVHNLVGGLDGQMRGGSEAAPYFEWGGRNADGSDGFRVRRPGWGLPIHELLVRHGVTAIFHGHDHLYARQEKDGVVYQEVPNPADPTYQAFNREAYRSGDILPNSGHLRVTVAPDQVKVDYVRAWLPKDETGEQKNGTVAFSYAVTPRTRQ